MAFKKALPPEAVPDSPEKILLQLPRRKIPGVLLVRCAAKSMSARAIARELEAQKLPTPKVGAWHAATVLYGRRLADLDSQRARARRLRVGADFEISASGGEGRA